MGDFYRYLGVAIAHTQSRIMSFPKYDRYKNSGVEWLGEVPEHWEVGHVKRLATKITDGSHISPETENGVYAFISTKDVRNDSLDFDNCLRTSVENYEYLVRTGCKPIAGDVLFSKDGTIGRTVVIKEDRDFVVASSLIIISPDQNILSSVFLNYLCQSSTIASQVECFVKGAGLPRLSIQNLLRIIGVFPPLPEQRSIATFLDRETTKIDELIAEQRQLIDLLKEKRQAVISHAVTKGLNPDAPMKDSAIEWLGEVPEHWEFMPLKRDLVLLTSGSRGWAENYSEEGDLFLRIGNLTRDSIALDLSDIQRVSVPEGAEGARTKVQSGDVLFSITAYLGSVAIIPENLETAYVSQHVALARPLQKRLLPDWIGFTTLSFVGKTYLEHQGYGGTKVQLSLDDVANLVMMAPPIEEQQEILKFIELETAKFDELIAEAHHAITLLQERRTALISAAVTGKIDVRSLV